MGETCAVCGRGGVWRERCVQCVVGEVCVGSEGYGEVTDLYWYSSDHPHWKHPALNFTSAPLKNALTSLPSATLNARAKRLFHVCTHY